MNTQNREEQAQDTQEVPGAGSSRRHFLRLGGAGVLLGLPLLGAAGSWAADSKVGAQSNVKEFVSIPVVQFPVPIVDARFPSEIAEGIWVIPDKRTNLVPNIGIVEGTKRVLVIDSGFTSQSGRNVLEAARAIAGKRDIVLTSTHAHPEHVFGAQAFKGHAKIFTNKLQRDYLARDGHKLLKGFRPFLSPDRAHLLDDIQITLADEVYEGNHASLDLGNRRVEFWTRGIAHSPGDQFITVPDQKVTFAGDLIEERMFPIVPLFPPMIQANDINLRAWELSLVQMVEQKPRIIVPGHGNLGGVEIADNVRNYFGQIRHIVAASKAGHLSEAEAVRQLEPRVQRLHPTWERSEFIAPALRYLIERT